MGSLAAFSFHAAGFDWSATNELQLGTQNTIDNSAIGARAHEIMSRAGGNTSPGYLEMQMVFTLTAVGSDAENLIAFRADAGTGANAFGFVVSATGSSSSATLTFGRMGTDNLCSGNAVTLDKSTTVSTALTLNHQYELVLVSAMTPDGSNIAGRGLDNFTITLKDLTDTTVQTISTTSSGFGLNGSSFARLSVGTFKTGEVTHLTGTVSSLTLAPEPATATLSLLALAGLAARRRRQA